MSLVFNMVGGGSGGGLTDGSALLSVTVPADSTVTATKSGVTLVPSLWLSGADASTEIALFVFAPAQIDASNPWTITATDGTNTASTKILISSNKEYEAKLSYHVPPEYQEVEYIETTGTQRINIPLAATKNINALKMMADIAIMEQGSASGASVVGDVDATPYMKFIDFRGATTIYPTCAINGAADGTADPSLLNTRATLTFVGSGGTVNIYKADTLWFSGTRSAKNVSNLSLLATYRGSGYTYVFMAAKLYKFEVYDTDHTTLLHDCYPCYRKSDNVAGFWDKAAETFYNNAGTGTFVVGPDAN